MYQKRIVVKTGETEDILREGQSADYRFAGECLDVSALHRLYVTCEDRMYYGWKDEPYGDKLYMLIDDSLDTEHAVRSHYCLDFSSDAPQGFAKRAARKVLWPPRLSAYRLQDTSETWKLGIRAQAQELEIQPGGYLRLRYERWEKETGIPDGMTYREPEETVFLDIPAGSYAYRLSQIELRIPEKTTACVMVTLEGQGYSGELYLEEPFLRGSEGSNLLPDFGLSIPRAEEFSWMGQNLSKKEWPRFRIYLNGTLCCEKEVFLRIHRYPAVELSLPEGVLQKGENHLRITYTSHYHDTVPVALGEILLLEKEKKKFSVVSCPEVAEEGQPVPVAIETTEASVTLFCESGDLEPTETLFFEEPGLHVAVFRPVSFSNSLKMTLICEEEQETAEITRMVRPRQDDVVCGSGDLIYIDNSSTEAVGDYLKWYTGLHLGNLITIRPAYRWGGQRTLNPVVWKLLVAFCEKMDLKYAHMTDGRDLPSIDANPSPEMLAGENFLGVQLHERDGQLFYWGLWGAVNPINDVFFDLVHRMDRETPETVESALRIGNLVPDGGKVRFRRDIDCKPDMKCLWERVQEELKLLRGDIPRHTGPSVMFKYFYQAGFDWVGAETMDSSAEPLLTFLRGAAKAYGHKDTGAHLALQWSTYPHDTQQRYRRYLLSLYIPYLHGVTEINTEEGWWHQEAHYFSFHRFSETCEMHRRQEQRFYRFVQTHSRTGKYYTPMAFLHGRYDGWNGFAGDKIWGMPHLRGGDAEEGWKLLQVFYPLSIVGKSGSLVPAYAPADSRAPLGHFSGTPRGGVDVVPVECGDYSDYKALCFAGYNAAVAEDMDRLLAYVKEGGILAAGWPHVSVETLRERVDSGRHEYLKHELTDLLTEEAPCFVLNHVDGQEIRVCGNLAKPEQVWRRTEEGIPLVVSYGCGKGTLVWINCCAYPGNPAIYPVYEELLQQMSRHFLAEEPSEVFCGEDVQYAVYVQEDGTRHYYLTPVDWYGEPEKVRMAKLRVGSQVYPVELFFGTITKILVSGETAVWPKTDSAEVLAVGEKTVTVQGEGETTLFVASEGRIETLRVSFAEAPLLEVCFGI